MINPGIENLIGFLRENAIKVWTLSTSSNAQSNSRIFESDPSRSFEDEIERMRRVLALCQYNRLYVSGRVTENKTVGNFGTEWSMVESNNNMPQQAVSGTPGIGMVTREEMDQRIAEALDRNNFETRVKEFEKREKEFRAEKRNFDDYKSGVFGTLLEKSMPYLGQIFGVNPAVAGLPAGGPVMADKLVPKQEPQTTTQAVANDEESSAAPSDSQEEETFNQEEADQLFALVAQYKAFDPDYLAVLNKLITTVTSGQPITIMGGIKLDYEQIKKTILSL